MVCIGHCYTSRVRAIILFFTLFYIIMTNFSSLEKGCPAGIPFSKCRDYMNQVNQVNQKKITKKRKVKRTRRDRKKTRRDRKKTHKIPPRGVIIRKKDKLYRSTGRKFIMI